MDESVLPLQFNSGNPAPYGVPSTSIIIQDKEIRLLFDTGAFKSEIVLSEQALRNIRVKYTGKQICFNAMDGEHCQKEFIVPEVKIGKFVIKNVTGTVMSKLWGGNEKGFQESEASRNGIIGLALLSKFNVLLDYSHAKVLLVKHDNMPLSYNIANWVSIPFEKNLITHLTLNGKQLVFGWDTEAIPSVIKQSAVKEFQHSPCPKGAPYSKANYLSVQTASFTMGNKKLPNTWFKVVDIPSCAPFDALINSNFIKENLVYFDFKNHNIYIKKLKNSKQMIL